MIKIIASLAVAAGLVAGFVMWSSHERGIGDARGEARTTARYELIIVTLKNDAARVLGVETSKVARITKKLNDNKNTQELADASNKTIVSNLERSLRNALSTAGRLRDPNASAAQCRDSGGGATGSAAASAGGRPDDAAEAGGLFSEEASGLLAELTKEADVVNIAYISCRQDATDLRGVLK